MSTAALQSASQLKVWEKIELVVGEGEHPGRYLARIQDFLNGGIVVTEPEFLGGDSLLTENAAIKVVITRDDAVYQFSSSIKRMLSQTKQQYLLSPPRNIERVQRRMFVRVEMSKRMSWAKVVPIAEWQTMDDRTRWHPSTTIDISGGGVLFRVPESMDRGTRLLLRISLFDEVGLPGMVAAIVQRCVPSKNEISCGAAFILAENLRKHFSVDEIKALSESLGEFDINAQNRLVSHIFRLQVSLRRKGLL